jgi:hypothetical protein
MKFVAIALFVAAMITGNVWAETDTARTRKTLIGVNGFRLAVEEMEPRAEKLGLTTERVKTAVETALRKARLPLLSRDDALKAGELSVLYVNVSLVEIEKTSLCVWVIDIELYQEAKLPNGLTTSVSTWGTTSFGTVGTGATDSLRSRVVEKLDLFINAYLEANPGK